jgi:hypothetical protein
MEPFVVRDCALLVRMSGLAPAATLRELRQRVAGCSDHVLYHHFNETSLRPSFDDPFYRNDFAVWASLRLRDAPLAERLGVIDPYRAGDAEALRAAVLEVFDERLAEVEVVPAAPRGQEFFFMEAVTVSFDTGGRVPGPGALAAAVAGMTTGSVYYHFLEARRRTAGGLDDFSAWLRADAGANAAHLRALAGVEISFRSLVHLREKLAAALGAA